MKIRKKKDVKDTDDYIWSFSVVHFYFPPYSARKELSYVTLEQ